MNRIGPLLSIFLTAAVLIFAVQNLDVVPITFLMWRIEASVALIVLAPFLIGLLIGILAPLLARRRTPAEPGPTASGTPRGQA